MIALDLYQVHYEALLIIYLKFTAKCVEGVEKEKKIESTCDFIWLKIINYIINAIYVNKDGTSGWIS